MLGRFLLALFLFLKRHPKILSWSFFSLVALAVITLAGSKIYQRWDDDPDRGAIAITDGAYGESYEVPEYLDQGWDEADSLWFYNTTQGSALLPYDFFLVLEKAESDQLFRSNENIDKFRYLPQKKTFFNPDALPVGFVKETYRGKDYVGFTCAACHTAQINYKGEAIRIDGGPAMADMVAFLTELQKAMEAAREDVKWPKFVGNVLALDNDYDSAKEVQSDLEKWTAALGLYNTINHSKVKYGHARLDAFGRIYNRVLQHVINKKQVAELLAQARIPTTSGGRYLLTQAQIEKVLDGVGETIILDDDFAKIVERLRSGETGYPALSLKEFLYVRNEIFNPPDAPVSYPFLWDTAQSDYVQWNGIASNALAGPLGRNAGEVIGVFGILDWKVDDSWFGLSAWLRRFSLSAWATGQRSKREVIDFDSSVDLFNLQRLERHLRDLKSPVWPEHILGKIDRDKAASGKLHYARLCQSCHEIIDRDDADRKIVAKMLRIGKARTDRAMAENGAKYKGMSGNFEHTYQSVGVGKVLIEERAPVAEILTAATIGVVVTPDPDKWFPRRWAEWVYTLASSIFDNDIKASIKRGDYDPDTTAKPHASLLSYKARSLNGIWATAPYLHNGSVPSLYDLLLPVRRDGDPEGEGYRPSTFFVGKREFNPEKVGFESDGPEGFKFTTIQRGNKNTGHEYGAGSLSETERWNLIEYLKTL